MTERDSDLDSLLVSSNNIESLTRLYVLAVQYNSTLTLILYVAGSRVKAASYSGAGE